jgi:OOP family OmpA-OmpF porin
VNRLISGLTETVMRPRRLALRALVGLAMITGIARAQVQGGFTLQTLEPGAPSDRFFAVPDASVRDRPERAVSLRLEYERDPLVLRSGGQVVPNGHLVSDRQTLHAGVAAVVADRVLLDAALPFTALQRGESPFSSFSRPEASALGDLRFGARLAVLDGEPLSAGPALEVWIPTGGATGYGSDGSFRARLRFGASGRADRLVFAGDVGVLLRGSKTLLASEVGSALTARAAAGWLFQDGALQVGPELFGRRQFQGSGASPLEGLLGARWRVRDFVVGGGVGAPIVRAPGSSALRVLAELTFSPVAQPPAVEARQVVAVVPPEPAAGAAEPMPVPGHAPSATAELAVAPPAATDLARPAPEVAQPGPVAPVVAEVPAPAPAAEPAAPALAEQATPAAVAAESAAPAPAPQATAPAVVAAESAAPAPAPQATAPALVMAEPAPAVPEPRASAVLEDRRIEIAEQIRFASKRAEISPESEAILRAVATLLVAHPEIGRLLIEGHTDAYGAPAYSEQLSLRRAQSVKRWLVEKGGVAAGRLEAEGLGSTRPMVGQSAKSKANRRIEFHVR